MFATGGPSPIRCLCNKYKNHPDTSVVFFPDFPVRFSGGWQVELGSFEVVQTCWWFRNPKKPNHLSNLCFETIWKMRFELHIKLVLPDFYPPSNGMKVCSNFWIFRNSSRRFQSGVFPWLQDHLTHFMDIIDIDHSKITRVFRICLGSLMLKKRMIFVMPL